MQPWARGTHTLFNGSQPEGHNNVHELFRSSQGAVHEVHDEEDLQVEQPAGHGRHVLFSDMYSDSKHGVQGGFGQVGSVGEYVHFPLIAV